MHHGMRRRCGASLMHPTRPELGDRAGQNCRTTFARPKQSQRISAKVWGIEPSRIYGAPCRGIILPMTRARNHANGVRSPSLPQLWLTAMLRAFVELVLHVASALQMTRRREAVIGTQPTPADLPRAATDTHQETNAVPQDSPIALILRSAAKLRVSKDEGVLTTPSVSHGSRQAIHLPQSPIGGGNRAPMPATKGTCLHQLKTGGGGSMRSIETEGAAPRTPQSGSVNSVHAFPAKAGTQPFSEKCAQSAHDLTP